MYRDTDFIYLQAVLPSSWLLTTSIPPWEVTGGSRLCPSQRRLHEPNMHTHPHMCTYTGTQDSYSYVLTYSGLSFSSVKNGTCCKCIFLKLVSPLCCLFISSMETSSGPSSPRWSQTWTDSADYSQSQQICVDLKLKVFILLVSPGNNNYVKKGCVI